MTRLCGRGWWTLAVAGLLFLSGPGSAVAQETNDAEMAEARALFMAGQHAVDSGRWADAVTNFSRAYELSEVPAALYNLGFALRALGRHREARDAFERLLERHRRIDRQLRRDANRYRDEAAARVAVLRVEGLSTGQRYVVRFDGQAVEDDGTRPLTVEADAGSHTLTVRAPGVQPFVWEGELEDGQRRRVDAVLRPVRTGGGASGGGSAGGLGGDSGAGDGGGEEEDGGLLSSPVFWIVVGAVLVGGGVLAGFLIQDGMQLEGNSSRVYEL